MVQQYLYVQQNFQISHDAPQKYLKPQNNYVNWILIRYNICANQQYNTDVFN